MKIATFSNGFQDTYNGHRPVTAAWAIIDRATSRTLASGHSLDRVKAEKTAAGTMRETMPSGVETMPTAVPRHMTHKEQSRRREQNARALAERRAATVVEIVDI